MNAVRTADAQFWNSRDQGVMVDGSAGAVDWAISASNGASAAGDDLLFGGRLAVNLIGGGVDQVQGAYGKGEDARATLALNLRHKTEKHKAVGSPLAVRSTKRSEARWLRLRGCWNANIHGLAGPLVVCSPEACPGTEHLSRARWRPSSPSADRQWWTCRGRCAR